MPRNSVITYPIPPYQNLPIEPQWYKPRQYFIEAIALGVTTTVTTTVNHDYVIGQLVRLLIPNGFGSTLLNEQLAFVIDIPAPNMVNLNINSNGADPFILSNARTQAQIVAVGDINTGAINRHGRCRTHPYIPGSFRDISPHGVNHDQ